MSPTNIAYVRLTAHAEHDRLPEIQGITPNLVIGRVKAGHGRIYKDLKDTEENHGHHYRMAIDDLDVTVCYYVEFDPKHNNKVAVVKTVFPSYRNWWDTDRFERWNGK